MRPSVLGTHFGQIYHGLGLQNVESTLWHIVVGHFPPFVVLAFCMLWPGYDCPRQVGAERARIVQQDAAVGWVVVCGVWVVFLA